MAPVREVTVRESVVLDVTPIACLSHHRGSVCAACATTLPIATATSPPEEAPKTKRSRESRLQSANSPRLDERETVDAAQVRGSLGMRRSPLDKAAGFANVSSSGAEASNDSDTIAAALRVERLERMEQSTLMMRVEQLEQMEGQMRWQAAAARRRQEQIESTVAELLRAQQAQGGELQDASADFSKHQVGDDGHEDEDDDDSKPPESITIFCILSVLGGPLGPTWYGVLYLLVAVAVASMQFILAHGYFDSAWLLSETRTFPSFAEYIAFDEFYILRPLPDQPVPSGLDRTFTLCAEDDPGNCTQLARFKVLTSIIALVLLACSSLSTDDRQTIYTMQPLDYLFFDPRLASLVQSGPRCDAALVLLWRLVAALALQLCWAVRALILPSFALIGTVLLLAESQTMLDIVLNRSPALDRSNIQ